MNEFVALGLIFITLKLCGVIAWSWWLVSSPFIVWAVIFIAVVVFTAMMPRRALARRRRK